ncbi:hypothetical protein [Hydrocoleum sp. CS-953]|uniref:hypothetical protein n=1 Tax=Hydrocoleum sp. CS-953 TaxID=1671698 RepID=UPI00143DB0BA|nr:hypothetical protein [Hydrocoleum sp. CS-953]
MSIKGYNCPINFSIFDNLGNDRPEGKYSSKFFSPIFYSYPQVKIFLADILT